MGRTKRARPNFQLIPVWPARPDKPGMRVAVLVAPRAEGLADTSKAQRTVRGQNDANPQLRAQTIAPPARETEVGRPVRARAAQIRKEVCDATAAQHTTVQEVAPGFSIAQYAAHGEALAVKEYRWQPAAGRAVPMEIEAYSPSWLLRDFESQIVITMVWAEARWRPWMITAASMTMWKEGRGVQRGMYLLCDAPRGTTLGFLEGGDMGAFKRGSANKAAAVRACAQEGHSYVFCTRTASGHERLWDGASDRPGGMAGSNDAHGTARRNNAAVAWQMECGDFTEDATIRAVQLIRAVGPDDNVEKWAAREVMWSYGSDFWAGTARP